MSEVKLNNIEKRYENVVAVSNMDVVIRDGEFVTLVGPSGCGKSTTMDIIAGLKKPTRGSLVIGDEDVTALPPKDRGIAMVFQNIALFPHMNIYDNISFGLRLRNVEQDELDRRVEEAASVVKLEGMLDRMPDELSGGQQQRVAIARSIVRNPSVFLMDEPLANLDAKLRVHMRTEIQRLHKELDTTMVYVTHDQAEAMTMSDRIAVMNDGKLQQIAPPLECYNRPKNQFVAGFIGSPSMNFVEGVVSGNQISFEYFDLDLPDTYSSELQGERMTLGIRPEDIYLRTGDNQSEFLSRPITAFVDVLEPMGNTTFAYVLLDRDVETDIDQSSTSDYQLLVSIDPDADVQEEDMIEIQFDQSNAHLFDAGTTEAITHNLAVEGDIGH